jgi:hypothetical protein
MSFVDRRSRHQIKKDHYEYKRDLEEAGLSDETSEESSLSSLTTSDEDSQRFKPGDRIPRPLLDLYTSFDFGVTVSIEPDSEGSAG